MKTKVIFRKFKDGSIIAIFPEIPATLDHRAQCLSYQHTGQHGACSVDISRVTRPTTPEERAPLARELAGIGYDLKTITRMNHHHTEARRLELERCRQPEPKPAATMTPEHETFLKYLEERAPFTAAATRRHWEKGEYYYIDSRVNIKGHRREFNRLNNLFRED